MPRRSPPPSTPEGYLATHDLKERGWTARLIRDFLGAHDLTRPNGLKMGRRRLPPVKLYLEERVGEAEREEAFLIAQGRAMDARERAERAGRTRKANRERLLLNLLEGWTPGIQPQPLRKGAVRKAREPYQKALEREVRRVRLAADGLTAPDERFVRAGLALQLDAALAAAYPWFPVPQAARPADDDWE